MRANGRFAIIVGAANLAFLLTMAALSAGERPDPGLPSDAMPQARLAASLEETQVRHVLAIQAVEGRYRVTAVDHSGQEVVLTVDPRNGHPVL